MDLLRLSMECLKYDCDYIVHTLHTIMLEQCCSRTSLASKPWQFYFLVQLIHPGVVGGDHLVPLSCNALGPGYKGRAVTWSQ